MNKKLKIAIIILTCLAGIAILIPAGILGLFIFGDISEKAEARKLEQQAVEYAEIYLEEKYPELDLQIISAEADEFYNGFNHGGWYNTVEVTVELNGISYIVAVDTRIGQEGCYDNIQAEEIEYAMQRKLCQVAGLDKFDCEIEIDLRNHEGRPLYKEKYNGDIIKFLKKEHETSDDWDLRIHVSYVDKIEEFHVNEELEEFISLCDTLIYVNFQNKIPDLHYTFYDAKQVLSFLRKHNVNVNSVWEYDEVKKEFVDYATIM